MTARSVVVDATTAELAGALLPALLAAGAALDCWAGGVVLLSSMGTCAEDCAGGEALVVPLEGIWRFLRS